jgi:hypothetical protein
VEACQALAVIDGAACCLFALASLDLLEALACRHERLERRQFVSLPSFELVPLALFELFEARNRSLVRNLCAQHLVQFRELLPFSRVTQLPGLVTHVLGHLGDG